MLDGDQQVAGDRLLTWLARMEHLMEEVSELRKNQRNMPNDYQTSLLMKGMETQLREWQSNMPTDISSTRKSTNPSHIFTTNQHISNSDYVQPFYRTLAL